MGHSARGRRRVRPSGLASCTLRPRKGRGTWCVRAIPARLRWAYAGAGVLVAADRHEFDGIAANDQRVQGFEGIGSMRIELDFSIA